jgi:hypothetical protein
MQSILIALLVFLGTVKSCVDPTQLDQYAVTEYGLYNSTETRTVVDPHTATGTRRYMKDVVFTEQTRKVPAQLGTSFGFGAVLVGKPDGRWINVKRVLIFPQQGVTNPATGKTVYQEETTLPKVIGQESHFGYKFDHPWEMVPGPWTFQAWYGDKKLVEQNFMVFIPPPQGKPRDQAPLLRRSKVDFKLWTLSKKRLVSLRGYTTLIILKFEYEERDNDRRASRAPITAFSLRLSQTYRRVRSTSGLIGGSMSFCFYML